MIVSRREFGSSLRAGLCAALVVPALVHAGQVGRFGLLSANVTDIPAAVEVVAPTCERLVQLYLARIEPTTGAARSCVP